jgi:hypothetical protein
MDVRGADSAMTNRRTHARLLQIGRVGGGGVPRPAVSAIGCTARDGDASRCCRGYGFRLQVLPGLMPSESHWGRSHSGLVAMHCYQVANAAIKCAQLGSQMSYFSFTKRNMRPAAMGRATWGYSSTRPRPGLAGIAPYDPLCALSVTWAMALPRAERRTHLSGAE